MTESEAKQALSGCEVSGHKVLCLVSSKGERFELSLTEHEAAFGERGYIRFPCWRRYVGDNG